ncbi:Lipoprotein lipase like protein [Argiope bruennichi]|uniref:Lipoprotein lipase like protein n=1 Tax=Argiope bruennichi TaxID=94029 RepID=A0A8T0FL40_ARGBR|nr:Lipoprotein lipase like protein [Argiope bruennichi]
MWKWLAPIFLVFVTLSKSSICSAFGLGESTLLENGIESIFGDLIPSNKNSSVQYHLFNPENPEKVCYIEPKESIFRNCAFNSNYDTKFLIPGYNVKLSPGNLFEKMKDTLLEYDKYNVIIVNWTDYNQQNYVLDVVYAYIVGIDVADMIKFLLSHAGVNASSIHLIGHSLGAQIAGVAGKRISNLGRITGLDPAGPLYPKFITFDRLTSKDADFVDAIHTSNSSNKGNGFGASYAMAWINFYPNGGQRQPKCQIGKNYTNGDGVEKEIKTSEDQAGCNHDSSITYFISSILDCEYLSTQCNSYKMYERGKCESESHPKNRMGLHSMEIPGLQDHSKFYLKTSSNPPYC